MDKKVKKALVKYFSRSANVSDLDLIDDWLSHHYDEKEFYELVKVNHLTDSNFMNVDLDVAKIKFLNQLKEDRKKSGIKVLRPFYRYAAVLIVALVTGYFLKNAYNQNVSKQPTQNFVKTPASSEIMIGTDKAVLTLDNGEQVVLEKNENYQSSNVKSDGKALTYLKSGSSEDIVEYNRLSIPRGGQFSVQLSDGTKVWLNSDTEIKYAVDFTKSPTRTVELLHGEAYFEVTSASKNQGKRFFVKTANQEVEVVGTKFNVMAYSDEDAVYTTLVEGSINLETANDQISMRPNDRTTLDVKDETIQIEHNMDALSDIAWINGVFSFRDKTLDDISRQLSRWYDVQFEFSDPNLRTVRFKGVINKDQPLVDILELIKNTNYIKAYEINNETKVITIQ